MQHDMAVDRLGNLLLDSRIVENDPPNMRRQEVYVTVRIASEDRVYYAMNAGVEKRGVENIFVVPAVTDIIVINATKPYQG